MIEVEAPDGSIIEFPDDMPQEQIANVMRQQFSQPQELSPTQMMQMVSKEHGIKPETGLARGLMAAGEGAADFATFGLSDEAAALMTGGDIDQIRQAQEYTQARSPKSYLAGQIGGGVGTGVAGGLTSVGRGLANYASKGVLPAIGTASGVGALSGGLYGAGSSQEGQRLEGAQSGAGYGAIGGVGGYALGSLAGRAANWLKGKVKARPKLQDIVPEEQIAGGTISGQPVTQNLSDITDDGAVTTMLKGARNQDVDLMRSEELARQGLLGTDLQKQIAQADDAFKQSVKNTMQTLAGETGETSTDTLEKSINMVKRRYDAQKALQGRLMSARNSALAKGKVYKDYTQDTLIKELDNLKKTDDFKVALLREENAPIANDFKILKKMIAPKNVKDINMSALAAWRSGLNSYKAGTQQGVLAREMAKTYDSWLDDHLKFALKEGDDDLVQKIFNANKKYAEFKNKYGTNAYKGQNKIFENIVTKEELTPRQIVNMTFGSSLKGKDTTLPNVKRMVQSMPEGARRESVKEGFRAGLMQRVFEDAYEESSDAVNFGKLKNNLIKMRDNDAFKFVTTPDHTKVINDLIGDLAKYQRATSDRTIVNLSGTTPMAARIMQGFGSMPIIKNLPLARGAAESVSGIAKEGAKATNKRQAEKSIAEFYKAIAPEIDNNIKFRFEGAFAGGQATSSQGEE